MNIQKWNYTQDLYEYAKMEFLRFFLQSPLKQGGKKEKTNLNHRLQTPR